MKNTIKRLLGIGQEADLTNPWMTDREFRKLLLSRDGSELHGRTIPIGVDCNGNQISYGRPRPVLSVESFPANDQAILPIAAAMSCTGSMVVLDTFGDIAEKTAQHREDNIGQDVFVIKAGGDVGINVFEILDPSHDDFEARVSYLAKHLLSMDGPLLDNPTSIFEDQNSLSLLTSLIVAELSRAHSQGIKLPTLREIYSLLSLSPTGLRSHMIELGIDLDHMDDRLFAGALTTVLANLNWVSAWANLSILSEGSVSCLKPNDGKTTIYLQFGADEIACSPIVKVILFTVMTAQFGLKSEAEEVLYVLPDMHSLGYFDFLHLNGVQAGSAWKIRLLGTVPSLSLFEKKAGKPAVASWAQKSGVALYSGIHHAADAEFISGLLGVAGVHIYDPATKMKTATSLRPLMSPDEIVRMKPAKTLAVADGDYFALINKV